MMSTFLLASRSFSMKLCGLIPAIVAVSLLDFASLSLFAESHAYKIEIHVSGPNGGETVAEENAKTELQVDTGSVTGQYGERGSAFATANMATGNLAVKVIAAGSEDSSHQGLGLASIYLSDELTFTLDPSVPSADVTLSMTIQGSPSCQSFSTACFTNAIIRLGDTRDQALGLPLPDPGALSTTATVTHNQKLRVEVFLSARVETDAIIGMSDPTAMMRMELPEGVTFASESGVFLGLQPPRSGTSPRAAVGSDLNGDGKADIVWRNVRTGDVAVWFMNGGAIASSEFVGGVPSDWTIKEIIDVNDDGMSDIVWHNSETGAVALWSLHGSTITAVSFPGSAALDWEMKGVADMDGNGKADIIWQNSLTGAVTVWLMDGSSISGFQTLAGVPVEWQIVGIEDVNADDKNDIIWRHTNGVMAVWLMDRLTLLSAKFFEGTASDWEIAGFGDMDGNGTADVVWRNRSQGVVGVWFMHNASLAASGLIAGLTSEWHIAQVGDANGDGMADIIWHNRLTGKVAVWLMDGSTVTSTEFPGAT